MKNYGFTLVELLTVIVLLGIIALITTVSTSYIINKSKENLTETQIKVIEKAAQSYYLQEGMNNAHYNYDETKTCVDVEYLIENDYIEEAEIKNPKNNKKMLGSVKIVYENGIYTYNYKDQMCNSSDYDSVLKSICTPVTEKTKTTGNVPQGNYLPADEYICEVKPGTKYRFFVLSTNNKDGEIITNDSEDKDVYSVNLIMERNMYYDKTNDVGSVATETNKGLIEWVLKADYNDDTNFGNFGNTNKGPITAMPYLHNATKDWTNIPNIIMNYEDESIDFITQQKGPYGYGSIVTTGTTTIITSKTGEETGRIETLKARMPRSDEVYGTDKCLTLLENENADGSCPLWLVNYLESSDHVTGAGLQNISGIYGYWTLSSGNSSYSAGLVFYSGRLSQGYVDYADVGYIDDFGVRPVITLEV